MDMSVRYSEKGRRRLGIKHSFQEFRHRRCLLKNEVASRLLRAVRGTGRPERNTSPLHAGEPVRRGGPDCRERARRGGAASQSTGRPAEPPMLSRSR